jgi:hypothetical protein
MRWGLLVSGLALGAAMVAAGVAAFMASASAHPNVEPSVAAQCAECHMSDYRSARHHAGEKPTTCGVCHAQSGWHPTHLEHPFALTGAHAKAKCFDCHTSAKFHGTSNACIDCHREEYERAPHHVGHFAITCAECHSFDAWKPTLPHPPEETPPVPTEPPPPPPPPSATATTTAPKPRPTATTKPKPRPTATATATPTSTIPDILVRPSQR